MEVTRSKIKGELVTFKNGIFEGTVNTYDKNVSFFPSGWGSGEEVTLTYEEFVDFTTLVDGLFKEVRKELV